MRIYLKHLTPDEQTVFKNMFCCFICEETLQASRVELMKILFTIFKEKKLPIVDVLDLLRGVIKTYVPCAKVIDLFKAIVEEFDNK